MPVIILINGDELFWGLTVTFFIIILAFGFLGVKIFKLQTGLKPTSRKEKRAHAWRVLVVRLEILSFLYFGALLITGDAELSWLSILYLTLSVGVSRLFIANNLLFKLLLSEKLSVPLLFFI